MAKPALLVCGELLTALEAALSDFSVAVAFAVMEVPGAIVNPAIDQVP
jgi:hypothetical protein